MGERARPWPLIVRRARAADHDAVMAFASTTWDGWDYIPRAWRHWLEAPDGVLLVATAGRPTGGDPPRDADGAEIPLDRPIAVARVAMLSPTEAWLEGIRVDPRVRGQGVATDIQVAELRWAVASGARLVRYATSQRNEASHRLGARHGLQLLAEFRLWQWHEREPEEPGGHDETSGFDDEPRERANRVRRAVLGRLAEEGLVCRPANGERWWQRLAADPTFVRGQRLYEYRGWTLQELTRALFQRHVAAGEVVVSAESGGGGGWALAILQREALPAEDAEIKFSVVGGNGELFVELADHVRRLAGEGIAFWLPDPDPPLLEGLPEVMTERGFHPRPWALHILARRLDAANPPPEPHDAEMLVLADEPQPIRALIE